jgi:predicted Zn finger-like uncharacterized protein
MLTRCPECGTTFRVTPEQLKMRSGRVRCGSCRRVFDALETLAEEAAVAKSERTAAPLGAVPAGRDAAAEDAASPFAEAVEQASGDAAGAGPGEETAESPQAREIAADNASAGTEAAGAEPLQAPGAEPAGDDTPGTRVEMEEERAFADAIAAEPETIAPAQGDEMPAASEPRVLAAAVSADAPAQGDETPAAPEPHRMAEKPRRPRTWPWALGVCAAVPALAVQALLHFRTELAVLYPETRPLLASACDALGCKLWRPRKPELVGIEASDLSVADGSLALTATLRNRAPFAQEYPHLELTLTDTADRALVRRVLAPTEYLPPNTPFAAGFGARAEAAVNLAVTTHDVAAAGYRLYLFYP